jgi:CMP-N-acetylneuraminic acid synthetase/spore coat polysaccharide biosynthesis predicted glycosyltransferase SpsG
MTRPSKVVSIIPARKGSKGIPRKNIRELGGKPLVAHAITTSKLSTLVDKVVVTTDSQEIAQISRRYGADEVIDRPQELATDEVPLAPVIKQAFEALESNFEYVLCFQPTVPIVTQASIDEGIQLGTKGENDSVVFVRDSTHQYWLEAGDMYEPVTIDRKNRQLMDAIYEEIGIFLTHQSVVTDGHRVGDDPEFYEVDKREGIDIDTYADWLLAESQFRRKQLVYRVTGNSETGTGHVYRGITIADHLFEHDILFAVEQTDQLAIDKLEESNYEYRVFENETGFIDYIGERTPHVIVNDVLDTSEEYVRTLKELGPRVINFEDLGEGSNTADAIINALYEYSDPPANHYFGFKYFCLRNEFRYATPHEEMSSVDRIMISFGGTDENNLTARTLVALSDIDRELYIDVVLGLGYSKHGTLEPILSGYPSNIEVSISQDINSMAEHMEKADLLISSNGRTLYEAGSLNLPVISIAQNDREQKHPFAHISQGVLSLGQANYVTKENISRAVEDYIQNEKKRETMRKALAEHDIVNGVNRVKNIIFE